MERDSSGEEKVTLISNELGTGTTVKEALMVSADKKYPSIKQNCFPLIEGQNVQKIQLR